PIDAQVTVVGLARDCKQTLVKAVNNLGDCAAIRIGGVEVLLTTMRTQALGLQLFTNVGIDPRERKLVVVKSNNHFMAAYQPIAASVIYIDSDGPMVSDF